MRSLVVLTVISSALTTVIGSTTIRTSPSTRSLPSLIEKIVHKWAPLVFLAPGEKFFPGSVTDFLKNTLPIPLHGKAIEFSYDKLPQISLAKVLPTGTLSESWSLVTRRDVGELLKNSSSFLHGHNPRRSLVPVYAEVTPCDSTKETNNSVVSNKCCPSFHVTYWMFYPYNQGKTVCTVDMGRFGAWPIPKLNNMCFGGLKEYGNHVGDWEHMSLSFEGSLTPKKMYVSAHDVGAIYNYDKGKFRLIGREIRKSILQRPSFPAKIRMSTPGNHPVLFAARGSHGLWAAPGKHRFLRIPRLYDVTDFGVPWQTWKNLVILNSESSTERNWLQYRGRWGNSKTKCHPVSSLGLDICELSDGPTGIPTKKHSFQCGVH